MLGGGAGATGGALAFAAAGTFPFNAAGAGADAAGVDRAPFGRNRRGKHGNLVPFGKTKSSTDGAAGARVGRGLTQSPGIALGAAGTWGCAAAGAAGATGADGADGAAPKPVGSSYIWARSQGSGGANGAVCCVGKATRGSGVIRWTGRWTEKGARLLGAGGPHAESCRSAAVGVAPHLETLSASDTALHRSPKVLSLSALHMWMPAATAGVLGRTPRRASSSPSSCWQAARLALASLACLEAAHSLGTTGPVAGSLSAGGCCQAAREPASVARPWRKVALLARRQLPPPETRPRAAMSPAQSAWPVGVPSSKG